MLVLLLVILVAGGGAMAASWFMVWATRRSPLFMIAAGMLLTILVFAVVVAVGWLVAYVMLGSQ